MYDPVFDVCLPTNVHRAMGAAIAIPAADAILFLLMLVGLLLRAHGNKVGIWRVLYNQVILNSSRYSSPQVVEDPLSVSFGWPWRPLRRYHRWSVIIQNSILISCIYADASI